MTNPSPGPSSGSAAWHALIKDRSIQFDFPSVPAPKPPPSWLVNALAAIGRFIGGHWTAFRTGGWLLLAVVVLTVLYIVVRTLQRRGWTWNEKTADRTVTNS